MPSTFSPDLNSLFDNLMNCYYTYDALDRLTRAEYVTASYEDSTYDLLGNRMTLYDGSNTVTYVHNVVT